MKEAVIVSTARTGLAKSYRGSFNNLEAPSMVAPVIRAVLERAGVEPGEVEDVIMGAALPAGDAGVQRCAPMRHCGGVTGKHGWHECRPPVLLRDDGDRHGGEERHGRRCPDRGGGWG